MCWCVGLFVVDMEVMCNVDCVGLYCVEVDLVINEVVVF